MTKEEYNKLDYFDKLKLLSATCEETMNGLTEFWDIDRARELVEEFESNFYFIF